MPPPIKRPSASASLKRPAAAAAAAAAASSSSSSSSGSPVTLEVYYEGKTCRIFNVTDKTAANIFERVAKQVGLAADQLEIQYEDKGNWIQYDGGSSQDPALQDIKTWTLKANRKDSGEPQPKKMRDSQDAWDDVSKIPFWGDTRHAAPYKEADRALHADPGRYKWFEAPSSVQIPELKICSIYRVKAFVDRKTMLDKVQEYLQQIPSKYKEDGKLPMLGCSGMKGIGKTAMLVHIAEILAPSMGNMKGLYMTFNGGPGLTNIFHRALKHKSASKALADAFATALMARCGLDAACDAQLQPSLLWLRQALSCKNEDTLVICVDEIGDLQAQAQDQTLNMPSATMSSVMTEVDVFKGKVVFIFSHIEDSVLVEGASGSGRQVLSLQLPPLSPSVWKELSLLHKWQNAASDHAEIHQLLLACCGHPRCLVDGLPAALRRRPSLLEQPTEAALVIARHVIIETSKFNDIQDFYLKKVIYEWFDLTEECLNLDELIANGLLLQLPDNVNVLNPLMLQSWATGTPAMQTSMRLHLRGVYDADAVLGPNTEKRMEDLMFHYEALLRVGLKGKSIPLRDFYVGGCIDPELGSKQVTALLPSSRDLVLHVPNFQNTESVLSKLRDGWILVSKEHNEPGVEFLTPWQEHGSGKLLVAAVQCKFVKGKAAWADVSRKLQVVKDSLTSEAVQVFPVVYATPNQETIQPQTYQGGVFFTEYGIFCFTNKLGILRLHVMKLGTALKSDYPWLEGSQVQETQVQQM